jgi:hypothetical protein
VFPVNPDDRIEQVPARYMGEPTVRRKQEHHHGKSSRSNGLKTLFWNSVNKLSHSVVFQHNIRHAGALANPLRLRRQ